MRKEGFSVVELVVIVLMLVALAGMVYIAISKTIPKGRASRIIQDLKTIELAYYTYKDEVKRFYDTGNICQNALKLFVRECNDIVLGPDFLSDMTLWVMPYSILPTKNIYGYSCFAVCGGKTYYSGYEIAFDVPPGGSCPSPISTPCFYIIVKNIPQKDFFIVDDAIDGGDGTSVGKVRFGTTIVGQPFLAYILF